MIYSTVISIIIDLDPWSYGVRESSAYNTYLCHKVAHVGPVFSS